MEEDPRSIQEPSQLRSQNSALTFYTVFLYNITCNINPMTNIVFDGHWGLSTMLTIYNCDNTNIRDEYFIKDFMADLVEFIDMEAYGEPLVARFGVGDLLGYSAIQLIYTSSITMHFSEVDNRAFIDIFSCKGYEPTDAAQFCEDYLDGSSYDMRWAYRD